MAKNEEALTVEPARRIDDDVEFYDVAVELVVVDLAAVTVRGTEPVEPVEGAERAFRMLRDAGVSIALTTSLPRETLNALIDRFAWGEAIDVALGAQDVGRAAPFPDLPLTALMRAGKKTVDSMVVVGDAVNTVRSGLAAGGGLVVGVHTGAYSAEQLHQAGADDVLESAAMVPALLGVSSEV